MSHNEVDIMKALAFALWLLVIGEVPIDLGLDTYHAAIEGDVDPATMGGILIYESPGYKYDLEDYYDEGDTVLGYFQVSSFWLREKKNRVRDFTREELITKRSASMELGVAVAAYFDERHARHTGIHTWAAHWTGSESERAAIDAGELSPTASGIGTLERQIESAQMWSLMIPVAALTLVVTYHSLEDRSGTSEMPARIEGECFPLGPTSDF